MEREDSEGTGVTQGGSADCQRGLGDIGKRLKIFQMQQENPGIPCCCNSRQEFCSDDSAALRVHRTVPGLIPNS